MTTIKDTLIKTIKGVWGTDYSDEQNGIPVIKTNNMTYEGVIDYSEICYRNITVAQAEKNYLKRGDLLIEKSGGTKTHSVGYVNYFDGDDDKYVCNNFILALRTNPKIIRSKYLFYQMRYFYESGLFSDCYNKTTGIQNLQVESYLGKSIRLLSFDEQDKVITNLDYIVSLIANKREEVKQLDELVKSRFIEMFEDKGYKLLPFSDYAEIIDGDRGKNYPKAEDFYDKEFCLFLNAKNVTQDGFRFEQCQFITREKDAALRKGKLKRGDIVITTRGTIGNIAYYDEAIPYEEIRINSGMVIIRPKDLRFNPRFFLFAFRSIIDEIKQRQVTGAAQPQLPIHIMSKIKLLNPPIELQNEFAEFVKQVEKAKSILKKQIADLQELLDSKMDVYFG